MIKKMKNGSTLIIKNISCAKTATVYFIFKVGSRYEDPKDYGISHVIEHILFKGTCNRPEAQQIAQIIDQYGGLFNAFTSRDMTGYYIKLPYKNLDIAIDILSDMILNSLFNSKEIKSELKVIINEIKMRNSQPDSIIDQMFAELVYKGTNLEHEIGGTKDTICKMDQEKLLKFMVKYYVSQNMIVSIAGKVSPKKIVNQLNNIFNVTQNRYKNILSEKYNIQKFQHLKPLKLYHCITQKTPRFSSKINKDLDHTFISLGYPIVSFKNTKSWIFEVIGTILAGTMGSKLFQVLREERGLVYNVSYDIELFEDMGSFSIKCSCLNDKKIVSEVLDIIFDNIHLLKQELIPKKDIKRTIQYLLNGLDMKQENTNEVALSQACEYAYLGKVLSIKDIDKIYKKITPHTIRKICKEYFIKSRLNLTILSPLKFNKSYLYSH
jgi:predicted Zn-dependent peptidase